MNKKIKDTYNNILQISSIFRLNQSNYNLFNVKKVKKTIAFFPFGTNTIWITKMSYTVFSLIL